jgi:hypothetical protein
MRARLLALPLLCVPLALLAVLPLAHAEGTGFASLTMVAIAGGETYDVSKASGNPVEVVVPYAESTVRLGTGRGVSSIAWPGEIGAALGTTIIATGGPGEASVLNDPVLAIAQSGVKPDASNTSVPGSTMTAHATAVDASATTTVEGASGTGGTVGTSDAATSVASDGALAQAKGASTARDITVGPVHVGAVASQARATTDGQAGQATGTTTVSALSVAGQAVQIDGNGLTVASQNLPAGAALAAVESALAQAQISLTLSRPTKTVTGGRVEYATGSLIMGTPFGVFSFGGVTLQLSATRAVPVPGVASSSPPVGSSVRGVVTPPRAGVPPLTPPTLTGSVGGPGPQGPAVLQPVVALLGPVALATGYRPLWAVVGLLATLALSTLFSALPTRWLPALTDTCPFEHPREPSP